MDEARQQLLSGTPAPFWLMAESQSGGRGRHGRTWSSPPGNLYCTLALAEPCQPARGAELGFVAGVALHEAVRAATGLQHPDLAIKWPNDLLLEGAKVAGLLLEGTMINGRFHVLIGFGVNIASAPQDVPYQARSLVFHAAGLTSGQVLAHLSAAWVVEIARWRTGFQATRTEWLARAAHLGKLARVRLPSGEVSGIMRGIDETGRLLLEDGGGILTIDAGDVFL